MTNRNDTSDQKPDTGTRGERLAERYLTQQGYRILYRNFRARHAEIDIICIDPAENEEVVFVEVKTRSVSAFGDPLDGVTLQKIDHLKRAAESFLHERDIEDAMCRFDVIGIWIRPDDLPEIEHVKDVVDY